MSIVPFRMPISAGFTRFDMRQLSSWNAEGFRVEIDAMPCCEQLGQFAMIYEGESCWASWAVGREGEKVLLWDCITLQTLGRFDTIGHALAAIPGAPADLDVPPAAQIIQFRRMSISAA